MAINYATKYSSKVDEKFSKKSLSEAFTNKNYEWNGVEAIKIFSINTSPLNDYSVSGDNRYGTPSELENDVQTMLLTQDKSFTHTLDAKSKDDTVNTMNAGKSLAREIREVVVPFIDKYVFTKMIVAAVANDSYAIGAISKSNAYSSLLDGQEKLSDALVPEEGRKVLASYAYYKLLKQDSSFILASDVAQNKLINGQVGQVDGMPIVAVPKSRVPANFSFMIAHPIATVAPMKLTSYVTHHNPKGINGDVVEGRIRFDAFVLNNKKDSIYVHTTGVIS